MTFINEVVSDEDIDRYGLPFKKGSGRYWTRDLERDYYLWGGFDGNPALGDDPKWVFDLFVDGRCLKYVLCRGDGSKKFSEKPFVIVWSTLKLLNPHIIGALSQEYVIQVLQQALIAYGRDGEANSYTPIRVVKFCF